MKKIVVLFVVFCFAQAIFFTGCGSTENVVVEKKEEIAVPTPPEGYIMFEESRFNTENENVIFHENRTNNTTINLKSVLAWTGYEWITMDKEANDHRWYSKDKKYSSAWPYGVWSKNGFYAGNFLFH